MARPSGKSRERFAPPDYTLPKGETPEDSGRVVYVPGKGLVPVLPHDPDLPTPTTANGWLPIGGKLANGLTPRADCFARLVARGVTGSDAVRAAWPHLKSRDPIALAARAGRIMVLCKGLVTTYRDRWERERQQKTLPMRDFVLSRLTLEAQAAPESSSRIKALDLLGKSEAMWSTVVRQEHTVSPAQLAGLKTQLEQRLSTALSKLGGNRITDIMENSDAPRSALGIGAIQAPETPPEGCPPLHGSESHDPGDTISLTEIPKTPGGTPFSAEGPVEEVPVGVGFPDLDLGRPHFPEVEPEYIGPDLPEYLLKKP